MTDFHTANRDYKRAKFATDWASAIVWHADVECSLSITQPIEFNAMEELLSAFARTETAAYAELRWYEDQASLAQGGGRHAGRE